MNNSKSGLATSATTDERKTHAATTDPVYSGPTGMDQSTKLGSVPAPSTTNPGNRLPDLPPMRRGN